MLYRDHIEQVCSSLMKFADNEETDLTLLSNHLNEIICDVSFEVDKRARLHAQAELIQKYRGAIKKVVEAKPGEEEYAEMLLNSLQSFLQVVLDNE